MTTRGDLGESKQSPWLRYTEWRGHLGNLGRERLVLLARVPHNRSEFSQEQRNLLESIQRVMSRVFNAADGVPDNTLHWARSHVPEHPQEKRFQQVQQDTTWAMASVHKLVDQNALVHIRYYGVVRRNR